MEKNIVNAEADTLDKLCYIDKAEKLSCMKRNMQPFLKIPVSRYTKCNKLNVSLMSET
ncbi:Uncharacterised protein [Orientia tsutsugamushi]|nr:Uncharacterised protein [Orientia tsutsugamushi]